MIGDRSSTVLWTNGSVVHRARTVPHLYWNFGLAKLDSGECHLRAAPTFSQMSRTHLKPGPRPGFRWRLYAQQLFNAPLGLVYVLKSRSHSENMGGECQKYDIVGNLVAVFKKFPHL
jgi:hypothetical protein